MEVNSVFFSVARIMQTPVQFTYRIAPNIQGHNFRERAQYFRYNFYFNHEIELS